MKNIDWKENWRNITTNYSHWLSFILLMVVAVIVSPAFLSWNNLTNLFVQGSVVGICAMGMSLIISAGMIDLSVGSSVALLSGLGVLGSFLPFGDTRRSWDFVSLGHGNVDFGGIIRELNRSGYSGPLSVEWEDSGMDREAGARESCSYVKRINSSPSLVAFDAALQNS